MSYGDYFLIFYGIVHCVLRRVFSDILWGGTLSYGEYFLIFYGMEHCVLGQVFSDILWDSTLCLTASIF